MVASTSQEVIPEDPTAYKTQEYWEERYKKYATLFVIVMNLVTGANIVYTKRVFRNYV